MREIRSNIVLSQITDHAAYGGVVPEIAARAHLQAMPPVLDQALKQAGCSLEEIDLIAATAGPGLIGGVIVGTMMAKSLAWVSGKPYVAVNHLRGHALSPRLTEDVEYPYLLLLISGGHCQWLAVQAEDHYTMLGTTLDDAPGEAFDKVAKMLGLGYPGGPAVEHMAAQAPAPQHFNFPRPLKGKAGCDFSFSGLKTAVRQAITAIYAEQEALTEAQQANICAAFQASVIACMQDRFYHAADAYERLASAKPNLVVAGGVAANQAIRQALRESADARGYRLIYPPMKLCTDNAAMIAWAGYEQFQNAGADELTFEPRARWPLS